MPTSRDRLDDRGCRVATQYLPAVRDSDRRTDANVIPSTQARAGSRICSGGDLELGHVPALMGNLRRPCILRIRPQPGRLVLFPSYIGHAVTPVRSLQPRISLAGDLGLAPGRAADRAARQ